MRRLRTYVLAAVFVLPLGEREKWQILKFRKIPPNQVTFAKDSLTIEVDKSSSPLIYPLFKPQHVGEVHISGNWKGNFRLTSNEDQGKKGLDDFILKLGLVLSGERRLNWGQSLVAADWVKTLFQLAPKDQGIDSIFFLNAVNSKEILGEERVHPLSDLIREKNAWFLSKPGKFDLKYKLPSPQKVIAIWLAVDGDDTQSTYTVQLDRIQFTVAPEE